MANKLVTQEWYIQLLEQLKAIAVESVTASRLALVEGKWLFGQRICEENDNFKRVKIYGQGVIKTVAKDLRRSERDIEYCVQFYRKYQADDFARACGMLPEGKNITWNIIRTKYLPAPREPEIPLPKGKFNVIYADPPWQYDFSETESRKVERHYRTMPLRKIMSLKIPASEDAVLFLWATAPKLEEALQVLRAWDFTYRTHAVWDKKIIGMGYWFRSQHELLLVGKKGEIPPPDPSARPSSVFSEKRGKHSEKPDFIYDLIEKMYPKGKYLELFARSKRKGWTCWGEEL